MTHNHAVLQFSEGAIGSVCEERFIFSIYMAVSHFS